MLWAVHVQFHHQDRSRAFLNGNMESFTRAKVQYTERQDSVLA